MQTTRRLGSRTTGRGELRLEHGAFEPAFSRNPNRFSEFVRAPAEARDNWWPPPPRRAKVYVHGVSARRGNLLLSPAVFPFIFGLRIFSYFFFLFASFSSSRRAIKTLGPYYVPVFPDSVVRTRDRFEGVFFRGRRLLFIYLFTLLWLFFFFQFVFDAQLRPTYLPSPPTARVMFNKTSPADRKFFIILKTSVRPRALPTGRTPRRYEKKKNKENHEKKWGSVVVTGVNGTVMKIIILTLKATIIEY